MGGQTTVQEIPEEQPEEDELEFEGVGDASDSPIEGEGETTSPDESETPSDDSAETEPAESVPSSDEAEQTADEEDSGAEIDAPVVQTLPENAVVSRSANTTGLITIGGSNRYETSAMEALHTFSRTDWAIVASGLGYADSISAAGLAGALQCPIILTEKGSLSSVTSSALRQMGVKHVILLGSTTVASSTVEQQLKSLVGGVRHRRASVGFRSLRHSNGGLQLWRAARALDWRYGGCDQCHGLR